MTNLRLKRSNTQFDLIPLVDMVFILLIFFAVSSSFIHKGIDLNLPTASSSQDSPKGILVSLKENHQLYLNGEGLAPGQLPEKLKSIFAAQGNSVVIVQADQSVPYQWVVDVLDLIQTSGISKVVLETQIK